MKDSVKYLLLIVPTFILSVILLTASTHALVAMLPLLAGWAVYYTWRYVERKQEEETTISD